MIRIIGSVHIIFRNTGGLSPVQYTDLPVSDIFKMPFQDALLPRPWWWTAEAHLTVLLLYPINVSSTKGNLHWLSFVPVPAFSPSIHQGILKYPSPSSNFLSNSRAFIYVNLLFSGSSYWNNSYLFSTICNNSWPMFSRNLSDDQKSWFIIGFYWYLNNVRIVT